MQPRKGKTGSKAPAVRSPVPFIVAVFLCLVWTPVFPAGQNRSIGERVLASMPTPGGKEGETPLLAVLAPIDTADAYLIPGKPGDVFPKLVHVEPAKGKPLAESDWLTSEGIPYIPPQHDAVIAPDYNPSEAMTRILFRLDSITTLTEGIVTIPFQKGEAFLRGVDPGSYCLVIPGPRPLATTVDVAGPVTLVRSDSWKPLLYEFYVSILQTLDANAFAVALSSAPYAQVDPLIRRLRAAAVVSPVELYVFYRGYYEGLALARWIETSPDGRLSEFFARLNVPDSYIDQLVSEALRQGDQAMAFPGAGEPGNPSATPTPTPTPGVAWNSTVFENTNKAALPQYRSFYFIGLSTFFLSESQDKSIPAASGEYFDPDEARVYQEEYLELAKRCYQWAETASPDNPLLPVLRGHLEYRTGP